MTERVVLITGASRGFGEAAARELARRGHVVVATMRQPERDGEKVSAGFDDRIRVRQLDVTNSGQVVDVVDSAVAEFGRLDAVISNAGYGLYGAVEELTEAEVARQFDTNFMGQWRVCRAVVPHMREAGRGTIINVSSLGARLVAPLTGMYSATKAAIEAMTECLRYEVDRFGIWVMMLEPGMYRSDWQTTSLAVSEVLDRGESVYQESAEHALDAFRKMAETRPGSEAVAAVMADMAEVQQRPPLRLPIGEDAYRLSLARASATDDAWEESIMNGPFFAGVSRGRDEGESGFSGY
jgi:NAD(P)-dependent dehydrogenase (short-subunit alcohol dehydrogenase family)